MNNDFSRDSHIPLYLQLKSFLLRKIQQGEWKEGSHLPTELELKEQYGLSRATVRQALKELESEGTIERRRGAGTIVSRKRIKPELMKLTGFSDDMAARGLRPEAKTLDVEFVIPPTNVQSEMNLASREKVWCVKRLRLADGEALGIHDLYIPPDLGFAPQELWQLDSYYRLLTEKQGIKLARANETLTASSASKSEAALLRIPDGAPTLVIWRTTYSENNQVVEVVKVTYRADRYEYHVQLYI